MFTTEMLATIIREDGFFVRYASEHRIVVELFSGLVEIRIWRDWIFVTDKVIDKKAVPTVIFSVQLMDPQCFNKLAKALRELQ